jgi:hypothetical protein
VTPKLVTVRLQFAAGRTQQSTEGREAALRCGLQSTFAVAAAPPAIITKEPATFFDKPKTAESSLPFLPQSNYQLERITRGEVRRPRLIPCNRFSFLTERRSGEIFRRPRNQLTHARRAAASLIMAPALH